MNQCDLGRQRENCILVAEEEILQEVENQPRTSTYSASWKSPGRISVCNLAASSKPRSGNSSKQRLKLALQTMTGILSNFFDVSFYTG
jgi:hypothetical protein